MYGQVRTGYHHDHDQRINQTNGFCHDPPLYCFFRILLFLKRHGWNEFPLVEALFGVGGLLVTGDRSGVELLEGIKADDDSKELRLLSNSRDTDVVAFLHEISRSMQDVGRSLSSTPLEVNLFSYTLTNNTGYFIAIRVSCFPLTWQRRHISIALTTWSTHTHGFSCDPRVNVPASRPSKQAEPWIYIFWAWIQNNISVEWIFLLNMNEYLCWSWMNIFVEYEWILLLKLNEYFCWIWMNIFVEVEWIFFLNMNIFLEHE
jgi:hypothetical protein